MFASRALMGRTERQPNIYEEEKMIKNSKKSIPNHPKVAEVRYLGTDWR